MVEAMKTTQRIGLKIGHRLITMAMSPKVLAPALVAVQIARIAQTVRGHQLLLLRQMVLQRRAVCRLQRDSSMRDAKTKRTGRRTGKNNGKQTPLLRKRRETVVAAV